MIIDNNDYIALEDIWIKYKASHKDADEQKFKIEYKEKYFLPQHEVKREDNGVYSITQEEQDLLTKECKGNSFYDRYKIIVDNFWNYEKNGDLKPYMISRFVNIPVYLGLEEVNVKDIDFIKYIVTLRKKQGLTQQEFADLYMIPLRTIQRWEQHQNRPADYIIYMLLKLMEDTDRKEV